MMKQLSRSTSVTSGMENTLQEGHCVRNRWQVMRKIGQGAFGEVYHCRDKKDDSQVAIKIVSKEKDSNAANQLLKLEVSVLRALQGQGYFPKFKAFGKTMRFDYLAMELLGPSLSELRRRQPDRKFSLSTTLRLGEMMLKCIQALHRTGYVHRDIKPSNFVMGLGKNTRKVFLLDFGLSRQFLLENGELRPARPKASFQGTPRYASINVLNHREAGRHDDLISLFYVLSEFSFQDLPWKNFRELRDVADAKESFDHQILVREFPDDFQDYFTHICDLTYADEPNYDILFSIFDQSIKRRGVKETDPLDFEVDELTPFVKLQKKDNSKSAHTQSDVLIVNCASTEAPVNVEEQLDNMKHQNASTQQLGESYVIEESSKKKICKNVTNLSINSNNLYSSCKDTGFSISPPGNQTFASVNTDLESPVSNDPKVKLITQSEVEPKKVCMSQKNESVDSLLKDSVCFNGNKTDNSQLTLKTFTKPTTQVTKQISCAIPLLNLCAKVNKPVKEKRRHSVRRSVSQPARIPAHVAVKNVLNEPTKSQAQQGLPRCWSCPTISLFIRSDLKPPLKQQASFEENVYEVDVMRNVAAARKSIDEFVQIGWRRNSLPTILNYKTLNEFTVTNTTSEQELANNVLDTKLDIHLHKIHSVHEKESKTSICNDATFKNKVENYSTSCSKNQEKKDYNLVLGSKTKVKKSLSDSNVVDYRKSKHLQKYYQKSTINSNRKHQSQFMSERNAVFNSVKYQDICNLEEKRDNTHSDMNEVNTYVSSNYSLCKSPTFKNNVDHNYIANKMNEGISKEQGQDAIINSSAYPINDTDKRAFYNSVNHEKNIKVEKMSDICNMLNEKALTSEENVLMNYKNCKKTDNSCKIIDPLEISESSYKESKIRANCYTPLTSNINDSLHSLDKENSQLDDQEAVKNNVVCENSTSESISKFSKSISENIKHITEDIIPLKVSYSKENISLNYTNSADQHVPQMSESDKDSINLACSNKSLSQNDYLHSLGKQKSQLNIPEVVIINASESSISESCNQLSKSLSRNKMQSTGKGICRKCSYPDENNLLNSKNCSEADQSSFQSNEFISPQLSDSYKDCINVSNGNSSFSPKSSDPLHSLLKENMQLNVPEASVNNSVSEGSISELSNKLSKSVSKDIIQPTENIISEKMSFLDENLILDSNNCNETDNSVRNNQDILPQISESYKDSINQSHSFSSSPAKLNNSCPSLVKGNLQLNVLEAVANNSVSESSICESNNRLPKSMSENINESIENITPEKILFLEENMLLNTNNCNETDNSFQNSQSFQFPDSCKQSVNLDFKNTNSSTKIYSLHPLNKGTQLNVPEAIENTSFSESSFSELNNKLSKSMSENIIQSEENTPQKVSSVEENILLNSYNCNEKSNSFPNNKYISPQMSEPEEKNINSNHSLSPNVNNSLHSLINESTQINIQEDSINPTSSENNTSESTNQLSKSKSENIIQSTETTTPRCRRRQRENSDSKYVKDEKELNLNFTRRRQRPISQIYEETATVEQSDSQQFSLPSALVFQHSESSLNVPSHLLEPPPGDPPPNHCLPSRRMRYRRALTSMTSS